ncbi:hypothetical protein BHM03_00036498 [Ensete ventricosum]|nr:hypothetical protein BHM03_00036498 [Ensete ventricosum]
MAFSAEAANSAVSAARGSLLHKFSFPILKTWGNQRVLRCMSVEGKGEAVAAGSRKASDAARGGIHVPEASGGDERGVEEVKEKLFVHLKEAADRMKLVIPSPPLPPPLRVGDADKKTDREAEVDAELSSSSVARPCKLRTRRRGSRIPSVFERQTSASPVAMVEKRPVRLRSGSIALEERPKFSITLTREEIEEDIYSVTGHRARRRPRKRPRVIQKQLDVSCSAHLLLFPGSWLSEITLDTYKEREDDEGLVRRKTTGTEAEDLTEGCGRCWVGGLIRVLPIGYPHLLSSGSWLGRAAIGCLCGTHSDSRHNIEPIDFLRPFGPQSDPFLLPGPASAARTRSCPIATPGASSWKAKLYKQKPTGRDDADKAAVSTYLHTFSTAVGHRQSLAGGFTESSVCVPNTEDVGEAANQQTKRRGRQLMASREGDTALASESVRRPRYAA